MPRGNPNSFACREMVSGVQGKLGKLDILVNNVGIQFVSPVEDFPEDKWDAIMDICLNSTFHATKAALPGMLERGWGRIINTGSMHALVASPYKSAYNAAKHGVVSLSSVTPIARATRLLSRAKLEAFLSSYGKAARKGKLFSPVLDAGQDKW